MEQVVIFSGIADDTEGSFNQWMEENTNTKIISKHVHVIAGERTNFNNPMEPHDKILVTITVFYKNKRTGKSK